MLYLLQHNGNGAICNAPRARNPDRRLLAYSSIGISPPRLHYGRAANYGSIIVPLRLSLPDRLRSGLCCTGFIALHFASWRACSLAQRLLTSQRRECICLDAYSVVKVPMPSGFHYAIADFMGKKTKLFSKNLNFLLLPIYSEIRRGKN